jgi:hypothetical protein
VATIIHQRFIESKITYAGISWNQNHLHPSQSMNFCNLAVPRKSFGRKALPMSQVQSVTFVSGPDNGRMVRPR